MKIKYDKILTNEWVKLPEWWGNPSLGLDCWGKKYKDGTKVYVFGLKDKHKEQFQISDFGFCVRNSHSGMLNSDSSAIDVMKYLDLRYKLGLIDHGRSLTENELKQL